MVASNRLWLVGGGVLLVGIVLAVFVFEVQTAFYDERADDVFEVSPEMTLVARGSFHPVAHAGKGEVRIYRDGGAHRVWLTDFSIDNGPALELRVVELEDASDSDAVKAAAFVDLGPLKGNVGNQSYVLPASFDATKHRAVVVWCERFGVNFVTAPLSVVTPGN